ncbi:hypothetical protein ACFXMT_03150 [Streptomyces mirabilis]|uniref:hypothetical protein n=1 Tax=Streptomyces mirabilis TaxID=68239 RepID=UPI00367AA405
MDAIGASQALRILEDHCIVPRGEVPRIELFAAFSVLRLLALGSDSEENANG